jgi:hypothetical protein
MADEQNGLVRNGKNLLSSFGIGNLITLGSILVAVITVYADIRSNMAVMQDKVEQLKTDLAVIRSDQQEQTRYMRTQLDQLSKDISYFQGQRSGGDGKR